MRTNVAKRGPRDVDDPDIGDGEDEYLEQDHLKVASYSSSRLYHKRSGSKSERQVCRLERIDQEHEPFGLLFHQDHFLRFRVILKIQSNKIRSAGYLICGPLNLMLSCLQVSVDERRHLLSQNVVHFQLGSPCPR